MPEQMSPDEWVRYQRVLDFLRIRKRAYCLAFPEPKDNAALADLAKFCRAEETCYQRDPRDHALAEGRREVWLRIHHHLTLEPEELYEKYHQPFKKE